MSGVYAVFGHKKVAGTGKEYDDYQSIADVLDQFDITELCHGGGRGVEALVPQYAEDNGIQATVIRPDLTNVDKDNKVEMQAQFVTRDLQIIYKCDEVIAFWDGHVPSIAEVIQRAVTAGKPVHVYSIK